MQIYEIMAETKTVNLRLPIAIIDYVTKEEGINRGMVDALETLMLLQTISLQEIRGIFTTSEWKFLADSLNGSMITGSLRVSKDALIAHNEDAELYDGSASKWGVDAKVMNGKIDNLSGSNIDAIYRRVEMFWRNPSTDIEKWAHF